MPKYLIIQTDEDDFYVECNDKATYGKIYASIPQTNSLRCIHGSDVPEGRELTDITTVPWDKLTDNDVMFLEKDMEHIIKEGIPNE